MAEKAGLDAKFKYCNFEDENLYCRIGEKAFADNVEILSCPDAGGGLSFQLQVRRIELLKKQVAWTLIEFKKL